MANAERFDDEYEKLLRNIHQLPKIVKPPIGKVPARLLNNTAKPSVKRSAQGKQSSPVESSNRDNYGLYEEFTYQNITQRVRWIEAGTFQMGSPEHEIGRDDDETLHSVTHTEGFWLADTACTQALWQAVMGSNPSTFNQAGLYPVETVSWNDVDRFIQRLNAERPDLHLRLPTEAEWEYACRAGSQSPFCFGDTISTEQANYNGNHPYAGGKQGQYREKTVEVTALEQNNWGLYQMHGNVWEWCSDWHADYPTEALINPAGPKKGRDRVLRGGSWISDGRFLRSAGRFANLPDNRYRSSGFRLAGG